MTIKGVFQELYIGKKESNIITFSGNKKKIEYSELEIIDYMYASKCKCGYLDFIKHGNDKIRFTFRKRSNEKISRAIDLIQECNEELKITEIRQSKSINKILITVPAGIMCCALLITFIIIGQGKNTTALNTYESSVISPEPSDISAESVSTEAFSTTLITGHYLVGTDIPVGTYKFYSKNGSGNLYSSDGSINVIFDHNKESAKKIEYSCAKKSQFRGIGNHVSGTGNHQVLNASLLANALVQTIYLTH